MIKIRFNKEDGFIKDFTVSGHSNYAEKGNDIVCASVSSIVITSVNLTLKFNSKAIKVLKKDGLINVKILIKDDVINEVLKNMIDMLKELSNDYKKYVKII